MTRRTSVRAGGVGGRWRVGPLRATAHYDEGMVLLETALSIPLLLVVTVALAWALSVATASLSLGDAARAAARDIARGESVEDSIARVASTVPGAHASVEDDGDVAVVVVTEDVRAAIPLLSGIPVTITQRVAIPKEWT